MWQKIPKFPEFNLPIDISHLKCNFHRISCSFDENSEIFYSKITYFKIKEGDIQHKIDQCADAKNHCYAQSIWDDKSHYSWELNQTTGLVWIGGSMEVEPNDGMWYNSGYNRYNKKEEVRS